MLLELFGWSELTSTYSSEEQARVRSALSGQGIRYKLKTVNRSSPSAISPSRRRHFAHCLRRRYCVHCLYIC